MTHSTALPRLLGAALLVTSCSSDPASPTTPTTFASGSSVSVTGRALAPVPAMATPGCPAVTPFAMPFLVTVTPNGTVGIVVTSITTQFTDSQRLQAPAVTLPAPVPTAQIGTALEQARGPQSFALDLCRSFGEGTLVVIVNTLDTSGRHGTGTVTVAVN
jgi:hypothetical protein